MKKIILLVVLFLALPGISNAAEMKDDIKAIEFKDETLNNWWDSLADDERKTYDTDALLDIDQKRVDWLKWYDSLNDEDKIKISSDGYEALINNIVSGNDLRFKVEQKLGSTNPKTGVITSGVITIGLTAATLYGLARKY